MKNIDGQTAVYGIIGNPIGHTLSPVIHNTISEKMGINSVYVPFRADDDLKAMTKGLFSLGVKGVNVTVPYKTDIIGELCGLDPLAKEIGAVNTLKYTKEGYYGYNTDILGLDRELEDEGIDLKGKDTVILGAGGAARAVAFLCASKSPASITIVNRTKSKAQAIEADIKAYPGNSAGSETTVVKSLTTEDIGAYDRDGIIVFQCTNLGLSPHENECVIADRGFYDRVSAGIDLIYRPAETLFMKYVKSAGGRAYNGLKMLIYQAVCACEIWNEIKLPEEVIREIEKTLKQFV